MPHRTLPDRTWTAVVVALVTLAIVLVGGLLIVASPTWSTSEVQVVSWVHGPANVVSDVIALTINAVFGPGGALLVVLIALAWVFLMTRSWRVGVRVGLVLAVPWAAAEMLKAVVQRPRPDPALLQPIIVPEPATFSYPSGHTAFAAALCCALIVTLTRGRSRVAWVGVAVVVVLVTAWSRVYLGVHYPTDVIASMILVPPLAVATARLIAGWRVFVEPGPAASPS